VQSWEYLEIELYTYDRARREGRPGWKDSMGRSGVLDEMLGGHFLNSAPLLNELGAQGWELVGVQSTPSYESKLILKRPRA